MTLAEKLKTVVDSRSEYLVKDGDPSILKKLDAVIDGYLDRIVKEELYKDSDSPLKKLSVR